MNFDEQNKQYGNVPEEPITMDSFDFVHETNANKKGKKEKPKKTWKQELLEWIYSLGVAVLVAFLLITFVGQIVDVSGSSMEPTLQNGDKLIIYKLGYTPKKGDIVVLEPKGDTKPYIKRVIATPGDTVDLRVDPNLKCYDVYVNGDLLSEPYITTKIDGDPFSSSGASIRMEYDAEQTCYNVYVKGIKLDETYQLNELVGDEPVITSKDSVRCILNPSLKFYDVYINNEKQEEPYILEPIDKGHLFDFKGAKIVPEGHVFVLGDNRNGSVDSRSEATVGMVSYSSIKGKAIFRIWPFSSFGVI